MEYLVQQLVTGLSVGSTYALVALGFALIFGVLNVLNIAHAQTLMVAPFSLALMMERGAPLFVALPASVLIALVYSYGVYVLSIKPFLRKGRRGEMLAPFIASFGISMLTEHALSGTFGSDPRPFPISLPINIFYIGEIAFVPMQVIGLGISAVLLLLLNYIVFHTAFGRGMRAVAEDRTVAEAQGISADRTVIITIVAAATLGAVAGLLFAATSKGVSPFMGFEYGLKALVVMIIGGVSSLYGAVIAALFLGIAETLTVSYLSSVYRDVVTYSLLFIVLLARPDGLFAASSKESRP